MSVVLVARLGHKVVMCADSALSDGEDICSVDDKVLERGEFLYGVCGDNDARTTVLHGVDLPESKPDDVSLQDFVYSDIFPSIKEALREERLKNSSVSLVVAHGREYVACDIVGSLYTDTRGYTAIGSGGSLAMAAIWALTEGRPVKERWHVRRAVEATCQFSACCAGPVHMKETG